MTAAVPPDGLIEQYRLLIREADHRYVNNLQLIASLLSLQASRARSPELSAELQTAFQRISAFQRIHRILRNSADSESVGLKALMSELCESYADGMRASSLDVETSVAGEEVTLSSSEAVSVGAVASELLMNAVKYGDGKIAIRIKHTNEACELHIHNDGPPLPADFSVDGSAGLGMGIVSAFVRRLDGRLLALSGERESGPTFVVSFAPGSRGDAKTLA